MSYFAKLPTSAFSEIANGCFDDDPFSYFLQFPVFMIRQNSNQLITKAYESLDAGDYRNSWPRTSKPWSMQLARVLSHGRQLCLVQIVVL
jgi:DNA-binding LacI/PurR family transcriptional regulator